MNTKTQRVILVALSAVFLARPSAAQPSAPKAQSAEVEALTDKARQLYLEGLEALKKSQWAEAHASFLAAWRIKPHYQIASNLGLSELKLGKHRDAAEHLTWYLREAPKTKEKERQRAQVLLAEARSKVATITMEVTPDGAEVLVDGTVIGRSPFTLPVFLEPGKHGIEARLDGYVAVNAAVVAEAAKEAGVSLRLEKPAPIAPSSASPAPGDSGRARLPPPPSPPVATGASGPRREVLIAGGVTAGAALIAGVVFTVLANQRTSAARGNAHELITATGSEACAQASDACREVGGLIHDRVVFTNVAGLSFIGAGALGVATGIYAFAAKRTPKAGLHATTVVTGQGAAVIVGGAW
jgi:hypothetical protein